LTNVGPWQAFFGDQIAREGWDSGSSPEGSKHVARSGFANKMPTRLSLAPDRGPPDGFGLGRAGQKVSWTTTIGPPTSGTRVLNESWRDALGGEWVCTGAGTPGTWMQIRPAAVTADPASGTIPTGYLIRDVTTGHIKRHTGGYVWEVPEACAGQPDLWRPVELARRGRSGLPYGHAARQDAFARGGPMCFGPSRF